MLLKVKEIKYPNKFNNKIYRLSNSYIKKKQLNKYKKGTKVKLKNRIK